MSVALLVPRGLDTRATGGNVYDRHLRAGLVARGWTVATHELDPGDPVPVDGLLLVDSLVASWAAGTLLGSGARAVPLVHMLFGTPGERELLAAAPAVVTTSAWTRSQVLAHRSVDPRRVVVAVPGTDRARLGSPSATGGNLLCVGTLTPSKGQHVLLEALARCGTGGWTCTLVGATDVDPDYVDELHKAAADAGITDRVTFTGALDRRELEDAYRAADAVVLPTLAESYGMVVTESLAHGVPVIASAVGGVPEALGEVAGAHPGMLVRPDDPDALATALDRWLNDAVLRTWLRRTAWQRIATLPRWEATAAAVARALEGAG
ncbi:glycosyltransferase family 4 protein [Nocardioides marmorisolisilvae]|uniref:Glycosyltransferase family 1 protein n=1 Tax=Nocardioides marmorisolisilvae TaxID=1542737 RepID=A0A3N0DX32_9ACTN|nr:glycosyltransferase family 4 protein [Nocardioides marmorisolisilvae]RNL80155.1 glycosyltransferase family 1 protein [Nocardioides marmorisolisilvae]